jgi:hypothetical protein
MYFFATYLVWGIQTAPMSCRFVRIQLNMAKRIRHGIKSGVLAVFLLLLVRGAGPLNGQELEPRAYSVSPVGTNITLFSYSYPSGDVEFDPSAQIDDVKVKLNVLTLGYFRSLDFFGRSANIGAAIPYTDGTLEGTLLGNFQTVHRSGLRDPLIRFAMNLFGAPAMDLQQFSTYRQKSNLGASLSVVAPLGQYNGNTLINLGSNRWAFKPEIGFSQGIQRRWILELDAGAWLFTANHNFEGATRTQSPIVSIQMHGVYTVRPHFWFSLDGNFYDGGRTAVGMTQNFDLQRGSRIGLTVAGPIARRNALKFAYSRWVYAPVGAKFNVFTVTYQFIWGAIF